jgi:hypothetical protein
MWLFFAFGHVLSQLRRCFRHWRDLNFSILTLGVVLRGLRFDHRLYIDFVIVTLVGGRAGSNLFLVRGLVSHLIAYRIRAAYVRLGVGVVGTWFSAIVDAG